MTTSFRVELDDVFTYGALLYQLGKVVAALEPYARDGEIVFPEKHEITTVLSDQSVGRWQITITADTRGYD